MNLDGHSHFGYLRHTHCKHRNLVLKCCIIFIKSFKSNLQQIIINELNELNASIRRNDLPGHQQQQFFINQPFLNLLRWRDRKSSHRTCPRTRLDIKLWNVDCIDYLSSLSWLSWFDILIIFLMIRYRVENYFPSLWLDADSGNLGWKVWILSKSLNQFFPS